MLLASVGMYLFNAVILILGIFIILLVLIQRGRGGGLAGMLGGSGGSSPFGSRAGDTFTRVTLIVAVVWIILNMVQISILQPTKADRTKVESAPTAPSTDF